MRVCGSKRRLALFCQTLHPILLVAGVLPLLDIVPDEVAEPIVGVAALTAARQHVEISAPTPPPTPLPRAASCPPRRGRARDARRRPE